MKTLHIASAVLLALIASISSAQTAVPVVVSPAAQGPVTAQRDVNQQNRIARAKHNDVQGNPQSASSQRMQANVQRNANQEARIQQGLQSGALTGKEAAKLERGQARVSAQEAQAGRDGHISKKEQAHIQHAENRQSKKIFRQKHDAQTKPAV
jgi:hypothetical protein